VASTDVDGRHFQPTLGQSGDHDVCQHVTDKQPLVGLQRDLPAADQERVQRSDVAQSDLGRPKVATAVHGTRCVRPRREPMTSR
jgi:hypothetical protein